MFVLILLQGRCTVRRVRKLLAVRYNKNTMNKYRETYSRVDIKECVFCHWEKYNPGTIIKENEDYILVPNTYPYIKDHLMVVIKEHVTHLLDEPFNEKKLELTKEAMRLLESLGIQSYVVIEREGQKAGKSVKHVHQHIIPVHEEHDITYNMAPMEHTINFQEQVETYKKLLGAK